MRYALGAAVSVATGLCCFGYLPFPVATVLRFLPSPRRPTAAAATSILEGSLDDQAISILAQAKLRILAMSCAEQFNILEKKKDKDYEDSTTRTEHQDQILFVAWCGTITWWTLQG